MYEPIKKDLKLFISSLWDTHGRVHPSNQLCPWKSAHTLNQTSAKPEFGNVYLIKGTFRQASFEAQRLHHFTI